MMVHFPVLSPRGRSLVPREISVWSQAEYEMLETLAIRVRLLAMPQLALLASQADASVTRLLAAGLLERYVINAHPLLRPDSPLVSWRPGAIEPDFQDVSDRARRRWRHPSVSLEVIVAAKQTANLFGSTAYGLPPLEHRNHDLLLSDAYLAHWRSPRTDTARWVGEEFLSKAGFQIKDPDAFLIDDEGHPTRVIESAGRYRPRQVERFHEHCAALEIPYELW